MDLERGSLAVRPVAEDVFAYGAVREHATMNHRVLWSNIEACLDSRHEHWRERVEDFGQVQAVRDRSGGRLWTDDQVFEAMLLAVLSSNTVWSKVERVQADLSELFDNFSLEAYASHSAPEIDNRFVPWFEGRRAGSMSLRDGLVNLVLAARILLRHSKCHGTADDYFTSLMHQCADDPKQAAMRLGGQGEYKLPSLGVALAAEALKNLGFDVAKPDRHMMRAMGSFGLVRFNRWKQALGGRGSPESPSGKELFEVITVAERVAEAAERPVVFVDNAIWLLCAKGELYLTNSELAEITHEARVATRSAQGLGDARGSGSKTQRDRMATIRFFQEFDDHILELPDRGALSHERELQEFFEKHLRTLIGVEYLASDYSTGERHSRRIDTLGIDEAGRPVVVEYKRHQDENVINQGLDHLAWLNDHQAEFRELVREKLGVARLTRVDFGTPRLLCVVSEFPRQDQIAAQNSGRRIELLRCRRYADAYVAVEWVFGGETIDPAQEPGGPPRRNTGEERDLEAPRLARSSAPRTGEDTAYSVCPDWVKASEETRTLFRELKTLVDQLGEVRTDPVATGVSFKCMAAAGNRMQVIAHVYLRVWSGLRVLIHEDLVRDIPLEGGFTHPWSGGPYREIVIRDREQIRKAEPLLRAAYRRLDRSAS